ncbi:GNAT family N-acetyltransferase [Gynuella sunshinyii]|uniref:Sortase and related acyltransferase n=1 Tax=Gynuella sunshinyii YC6258 TaxID=1445510 RepID=A0A0C5VJQ5_9GAMM|nr:GNAT family N-acetyltransferase [Gynuella sunshinyii]AJQ94521.1 sortase and related acyltransferase [Gynuella sunshinyii YC6258]
MSAAVFVSTQTMSELSMLNRYLDSLTTPIDSNLEDVILSSALYRIMIDDQAAGLFAVNDSTRLTLFWLERPFLSYASDVFQQVCVEYRIENILVSTSETLLLSLAMDYQKHVTSKGHCFAFLGETLERHPGDGLTLAEAVAADLPLIRQYSGHFFNQLESNVANHEIYLARWVGELIGFGIIEHSRISRYFASVGMFVLEQHRGSGYGAKIVAELIRRNNINQLQTVACCRADNVASIHSLTSAGLASVSRLIQIDL